MKYSNKLSTTFFLIGLLALVVLSLAIYKFNYDSLIEEQSSVTESTALEIADDIDFMLAEKIKTTLTLANSNALIRSLEQSIASYSKLTDEERMESIEQLNETWKSTSDPYDDFILGFTENSASQYFKKQQTILNGEYGEIFLTNRYGALVASTGKISTFAHAHKYWWKRSFDNGNGAFFFDDRGYDDSVGGYVLGLVVPIKKDEKILGILKCNFNILGNITDMIGGAGDKLFGVPKLARSGGLVIVEEGREPLSRRLDLNIIQKLNSTNQGTIVADNSAGKYLVGFSKIKMTNDSPEIGFGGTFESIDHKKGNEGESWFVLFYREMSAVQAPIFDSIRASILTGSTILVCLLLASYVFGKKIAQPLTVICEATKKIGQGDFDCKVEIQRGDEYGTLAGSLNEMAAKLRGTTISINLLEEEIEERKKVEEALRRSEEKSQQSLNRFRTIFEEAPLGIALIDSLNGQIYEVNEKFANIAGRKREEMIQIDWMEITHKDDVQEDLDNMARLNAGEINGFQMEKRYIQPDGTVRWINMTISPVLVRDKRYPRHLCMIEDISERKDLEHQVSQVQKMELDSIGTLAGGIAHDFNNLLFAIMGNLSLVRDELGHDTENYQLIMEAEDACIKAKELTATLITFSKGGDPVKKITPIHVLLKETVLSALRGSNITPIISSAENFRKVGIDEFQIKQAITNIVVNAKEAMEGNGELFVTCENIDITDSENQTIEPGEFIKISIKDKGPGILMENVKKIFYPYFSTKNMGTKKGQGLGLTVSYSIIKKHGGIIRVDSEPQEGTTFTIYLPAYN